MQCTGLILSMFFFPKQVHSRRGALGPIRNRKTTPNLIKNRKTAVGNKFRSKPKTAYKAEEPEHIKEWSGSKIVIPSSFRCHKSGRSWRQSRGNCGLCRLFYDNREGGESLDTRLRRIIEVKTAEEEQETLREKLKTHWIPNPKNCQYFSRKPKTAR